MPPRAQLIAQKAPEDQKNREISDQNPVSARHVHAPRSRRVRKRSRRAILQIDRTDHCNTCMSRFDDLGAFSEKYFQNGLYRVDS